jgi:DNA helicase-2/ATP-dependent DNA helicase PcrA
VILAGPGAGKTRLLVAKAAYLASHEIDPPQRVACLTFATEAAEEIRRRLRALHPDSIQIATCSTVHAFCLSEILTPFSAAAGFPPIAAHSVIDATQQQALRIRAYDEARITDDPRFSSDRDIACRRALFSGQGIDRFSHDVVYAARFYDRMLADSGLLDFESMVGRALQLLRERPTLCRIVASRFPWLLVDEYQDLGPVLHSIVTVLQGLGVHIFAVGDADQSIHGFTGSDPRYLLELADRRDFRITRLHVNYRSGHVIVDAAARVLGEDRGYRPSDGAGPGLLDHQPVPGGITRQAQHTAVVVSRLIAEGALPHEISVLYARNRRRYPICDWIVEELNNNALPLLHERARKWPHGRIVRFLQRLASWQVDRQAGRGMNSIVRFDDLAEAYSTLRSVSWHRTSERLAARVKLWDALQRPITVDDGLTEWVRQIDISLGLSELLRREAETQEASALSELVETSWSGVAIAEFISNVEASGKVTVTTYHASKGREWPYVVLPFLQEGIVPDWPLDYGRPYLPSDAMIAEQRRLFYVALTRAQRAAVLIYSPGYGIPTSMYAFHASPSRFITELPGFPSEVA